MWWLPSADRLLTGGGRERGQRYNSETPCEPAIDQIVTPCSARLSHHQAQDIIGLTHTNGVTHANKDLIVEDLCQLTNVSRCAHTNTVCVLTYPGGQTFAMQVDSGHTCL